MPGTGRIGVVQVVPALAERQDRERPEVRGPVAAVERALSIDMAHRVYRPRGVVQERDPHEAGPEERRQRPLPGPRGEAADERRQYSRAGDDPREEPVDLTG